MRHERDGSRDRAPDVRGGGSPGEAELPPRAQRRPPLAALALRTGRELAWFGTFALAAATVLGAVAVAAKIGVCVAGGDTFLLAHALTSWRTVAVLPAAVLLVAARSRSTRGPSARHLRRDALRWAAGVAAAAAVLALRMPHVEVNAFGWNVAPANARFWIDERHPLRPPALVTTNAYGFRDGPWTPAPAPGVTRVVAVGDSYVFGSGVPEEGGTLPRQLEAALRAGSPDRRWEVLNAARQGWGFVSYFEVARRLVRELRPRAVVIGSLGWSDWHILEDGQLFSRLGPLPYRLLAALSVVDDLREASILLANDAWAAWQRDGRAPGQERIAGALEALLREADAAGVEIVVWEYYDPLPFFDTYEGRPRFHRAGWPAGFDRGWDGWGNDPALAIPVDRHPTAEGNRLVADALAPVVAAAVASARGAGAPQAAGGPHP